MGQIPTEIQIFLGFASKWTDKYLLQTKFMKYNFFFIFQKIFPIPSKKSSEMIRIHICSKPISYSIEHQEIISTNTKHKGKNYKTKYSIHVKGDNAIPKIIQDTEKILLKKDKLPFKSYYPF